MRRAIGRFLGNVDFLIVFRFICPCLLGGIGVLEAIAQHPWQAMGCGALAGFFLAKVYYKHLPSAAPK